MTSFFVRIKANKKRRTQRTRGPIAGNPEKRCALLCRYSSLAGAKVNAVPGAKTDLTKCCPAEESILPSYWHRSNLLMVV